jgi:hypothetical protein
LNWNHPKLRIGVVPILVLAGKCNLPIEGEEHSARIDGNTKSEDECHNKEENDRTMSNGPTAELHVRSPAGSVAKSRWSSNELQTV